MSKDDKQYYDESAFSFGALFKLIKKALPMILVFVLLSVIIGCIAGGVISSSAKETRETSIYFNLTYTGADKGLAPNAEKLIVEDFKNIDRIAKVLSDNNLNYQAADLKSAIVIKGNYDAKTQQSIAALGNDAVKIEEFFKSSAVAFTTFRMSVSHDKLPNVKEGDLELILNGLIEYNRGQLFATGYYMHFLQSGLYTSEYFGGRPHIAQFVAVDKEVARINNHIESVISSKNDGILSAIELIPVIANMNVIFSKMANYESYLLSNGITDDLTSTINYLKAELAQKKSQYERYVIEDVALAKMIKDYSVKQIIVTADGKISDAGFLAIEQYNNMYNRQSELVTSMAAVKADVVSMEARLAKYEALGGTNTIATAEQVAEADRQFGDILLMMSKTTEQYEGLLDKNTAEKVTTGFKFTSAVSSNIKLSGVSWLLIVATCIVVGMVVGMIAYIIYEKQSIKRTHSNLLVTNTKQIKLDNVLDSIDEDNKQ